MPHATQVLVFANPIAGRGRGRIIAERLIDRLNREGFEVVAFLEPADRLAPAALDATDAFAAIVIGGDGTLRTVARQLVRHSSRIPPLLIVPMGTANLMGRHLGIQWDDARVEDQVMAALRHPRLLHLDAAAANGELFLLMAGIGLDAHIVHELARRRAGPIRYASYLLPGAIALGNYAYPPLTVTVDDRVVFDNRPALAFVGNVKEYGTGFPILPHARPDDDLLDICVLPCANRSEAMRLALHAVAGEHLQADGVVYLKGRRIRIDSPHAVPVQIDGEPAGHTPLDLDLLPVRVPFIVPK